MTKSGYSVKWCRLTECVIPPVVPSFTTELPSTPPHAILPSCPQQTYVIKSPGDMYVFSQVFSCPRRRLYQRMTYVWVWRPGEAGVRSPLLLIPTMNPVTVW